MVGEPQTLEEKASRCNSGKAITPEQMQSIAGQNIRPEQRAWVNKTINQYLLAKARCFKSGKQEMKTSALVFTRRRRAG